VGQLSPLEDRQAQSYNLWRWQRWHCLRFRDHHTTDLLLQSSNLKQTVTDHLFNVLLCGYSWSSITPSSRTTFTGLMTSLPKCNASSMLLIFLKLAAFPNQITSISLGFNSRTSSSVFVVDRIERAVPRSSSSRTETLPEAMLRTSSSWTTVLAVSAEYIVGLRRDETATYVQPRRFLRNMQRCQADRRSLSWNSGSKSDGKNSAQLDGMLASSTSVGWRCAWVHRGIRLRSWMHWTSTL